jgi:hypothetical protein
MLERGNSMEAICKADFDIRVKEHSDSVKEVEDAKKKGHATNGIIVPEIGYHDIYGVWFFGKLKEIVKQIGITRYGIDLGKMMHVYVNVDPKKIDDGVHDITVYGYSCRLYKWMAQGYNRGLIVLADDEAGKQDASVYHQSGTWSWVLKG